MNHQPLLDEIRKWGDLQVPYSYVLHTLREEPERWAARHHLRCRHVTIEGKAYVQFHHGTAGGPVADPLPDKARTPRRDSDRD